MWELDHKESWAPKNWCFWTVVLEKTLESPLDSKEIQPVNPKGNQSVLNIHWKDCCWSWNSNILATWYEELTHLKRPWCWERLKVGEGDNRGWDGWMVSLTRWMWVWVNSGSWWWISLLARCSPWGCRVGHDWATELNWLRKNVLVFNIIDTKAPTRWKKLSTWWPDCKPWHKLPQFQELASKKMGTKRLWNWRWTVPRQSQDDAG